MAILMLLRHAKSDWSNEGLSDIERPLNHKGRKCARRLGKYLKKFNMIPDLIRVSPAKRALQTLELMQEQWDTEDKNRCHIIETKDFYPGNSNILMSQIAKINMGIEKVMFIGHNPGMESLIALLGRFEEQFHLPTAGMVVFRNTSRDWKTFVLSKLILDGMYFPNLVKTALNE